MASSRTVVIAGAGIGGLTAALALARRGFRIDVMEAAGRLEEVGAGIQLSPNAARILLSLGLGKALNSAVVAPQALRVIHARSGELMACAPLGRQAQERYGAPYWVIHRSDLQAALLAAVNTVPGITLHLGTRVEAFALDGDGVTVDVARASQLTQEPAIALIGADGLWSRLRGALGHGAQPRFARHTAWRSLVPAEGLGAELRAPAVNLWLGRHAHLVHYPVRGGRLVNVVAILQDQWREAGWSAPGERAEILARFPADRWQGSAREIVAAAAQWQKWALYDCAPLARWGRAAVTLLGDAAHPMLPYLAQGAAMAVEDAAVLGQCFEATADNPALAMRRYEDKRRARTARAQRAARRNALAYSMGGSDSVMRTLARLAMRGDNLLRRYDWLYGWRPEG